MDFFSDLLINNPRMVYYILQSKTSNYHFVFLNLFRIYNNLFDVIQFFP